MKIKKKKVWVLITEKAPRQEIFNFLLMQKREEGSSLSKSRSCVCSLEQKRNFNDV